jgi:hypothetical protein
MIMNKDDVINLIPSGQNVKVLPGSESESESEGDGSGSSVMADSSDDGIWCDSNIGYYSEVFMGQYVLNHINDPTKMPEFKPSSLLLCGTSTSS